MATTAAFALCCWMFISAASAVNLAPATSIECSTLNLGMAECLPFVTAGGTATKPTARCCSGLANVLNSNPDCLCEGFKTSAQLGIKLNMTKAETLPDACNLSAPPISSCGPSTSPAIAPALAARPRAPVGLPPSSSSIAGAPSFEVNAFAPGPSQNSGASTSSGAVAAAAAAAAVVSVWSFRVSF